MISGRPRVKVERATRIFQRTKLIGVGRVSCSTQDERELFEGNPDADALPDIRVTLNLNYINTLMLY